MPLNVIGVPYNSSGLTSGEARAPAALRRASLLAALEQAGGTLDSGDVRFGPPLPVRDASSGIIAPDILAEMVNAVRDEVGGVLRNSHVPLVVGGDCPLLLGCLAAARDVYGRTGLLFVDGHEDVWPPHTSTTGEAADMELGLALGLTTVEGIEALAALLPLVHPSDVVVLGPRDLEEQTAAGVPSVAATVAFVDDATLRQGDIAATTRALLDRMRGQIDHWWFHLDLDVLSSAALAAVAYPQPGGLSWHALETVTEAALQTPGLIGWDVTIYNPDLDPDGRGAKQIVAFLGAMARHLA
ncbi:MAG: arginase family protein [Thermomicrobiales bacterium]